MVLGRDISGRVEVCMQLKATLATHKATARTAVVAGVMPTPTAGLGGMSRINRDHREKFGFPFIAALRLHRDLESLMAEGEASLNNGLEAEVDRTLWKVSAIVYGRLCRIIS